MVRKKCIYKKVQILKTENRREYKINCTEHESIRILNFYNNKLSHLYKDRLITSLYFDSLNFDIYRHNSINDSDKFTIRYRRYNDKSVLSKEVKINNSSGKKKIVDVSEYSNFSEIDVFIYKGRTYYPSLFTSYNRTYLQTDNLRITLDKNITFKSHSFRNLHLREKTMKSVVVEFKLLNASQDIDILKNIVGYPIGFSKFLNGTERLYKNIL